MARSLLPGRQETAFPAFGPEARRAEEEHLLRAERIVVWFRWASICLVVLIIHTTNNPVNFRALHLLIGIAVVVGAAAHYLTRTVRWVRRLAPITTLADALFVGGLCYFSGGLVSDLRPFLFVTVLGTAIRYGLAESAAIAAFNSLIVLVLIPATEPAVSSSAPLSTIGFIFLIGTLAGLLSEEQKRYHVLAVEAGSRAARLLGERQDLLRRVISAQEEERKRVVGELHDRLGRMIFEILYEIRHLEDVLDPLQTGLQRRLQAWEGKVAACAEEVRNFMEALRPAVLDDFGFPQAVTEYVESQAPDGQAACQIRLEIEERRVEVPTEAHLMFFRIVQEALVNVQKHSCASVADIYFGEEDNAVVLRIKDNGKGFQPEKVARGHYGLLYMRERAEACGARWKVESAPGCGTLIEVVLPKAARPTGA